MHLCFFQHRDSENSRPIYEVEYKKERKVEFGGKDKDDLPDVETIEFDKTKKTADEHWAIIEEKYGQSAYDSLITATVDRIMDKSPENYKEAILKGSKKRYKVVYDRIFDYFINTQVDLEAKFNGSVKYIVEKTKSELGVLKSAMEGTEGLIEFTDEMPTPEDKSAVEKHFDKYLYVMRGRYFNTDVNEGVVIPGYGIPVLDPLLNPDLHALPDPIYPEERSGIPVFGIFTGSDYFKGIKYNTESASFQNKMEVWVEARLAWLLNKKGTTKKDLEEFKKEIDARYEIYSKIDGSSSIISGRDLAALKELSEPPLDAIGRVLDEGDNRVVKRLEVMHLLNHSVWKETTKIAGTMLMKTALDNGFENEFIAAASKYKKVDDFDDAVKVFDNRLAELSKVGVAETLAFLREFNTEVHSEILDYEINVSPKGIAMQVSKQLDYILGGVLKPHWEEDLMLVRFMTSSREEKHSILSDDRQRSILFTGIKLATTKYPDIFDDMIGGREKFKRSIVITKPSRDDQAAQLKALEILGHQSKVIVSKLNKTPQHRGKDFEAQIDDSDVPDDNRMVQEGLKFSAPSGTKRARFRSALDRGGFNARDLALKGVKILGVVTVLSNVAQSFSETQGDWPERLMETVEKVVTNPSAIAGALATAGAHMAERNPAFLKFPWLSKYHKVKVMTSFNLENIAARLGSGGNQVVKRFTHNEAEWDALNHREMTGKKIQELVREKAKNAKGGLKPVISIEDLKGIITEPNIIRKLTRGTTPKDSYANDRMRYLFYEKFFARPVKPYVNRLKTICMGSSYIPSGPMPTNTA